MTVPPVSDGQKKMNAPSFAAAIDTNVYRCSYPEQYYAFQNNEGETFQLTQLLFDPDMFFTETKIKSVDDYIQTVFNVCKIGLMSNIKLNCEKQKFGSFYSLYAAGMRHIYRAKEDQASFIGYHAFVDLADMPNQKRKSYKSQNIVDRIVDYNVAPNGSFDSARYSFCQFGVLDSHDPAFYASPEGQNTVLAVGFHNRVSQLELLNSLYEKQNGQVSKDTIGSRVVWQSNYFIKKGLTKYALDNQVPIFATYFPSPDAKDFSFRLARECFDETGGHHSAAITNPLSEPYAWLNAKNIKNKKETGHPLYGTREMERIDEKLMEMKTQFENEKYVARLHEKLNKHYSDRDETGIPYPTTDNLSWKDYMERRKADLLARSAKKEGVELKSSLTNAVKPYNNMGIQPGGQFLAP